MLPPPGPSPNTTAARKLRGAERCAQARMRVLDRNSLTEEDITKLTEVETLTFGQQILFELVYSDWAEQQTKFEGELCKLEDAADVADRRVMVLAENAKKDLPYPSAKIRSLLRIRRRDIEKYFNNLYLIEMFGSSPQPTNVWKPSVDVQSVIAGMTAEAIHKQAFYMEGESERLTKLRRRRRQAQLVLDFPKYALAGGAVVVGLFALGIAIDLLEYLHRAPTVVALRHALSRLLDWLFTDAGLVSASVTIIVVIVFIKLRKRLRKFAKGA